MPDPLIAIVAASVLAITTAAAIERQRRFRALHPRERGRFRNAVRTRLGFKPKIYRRKPAIDLLTPPCNDPGCPHPRPRPPEPVKIQLEPVKVLFEPLTVQLQVNISAPGVQNHTCVHNGQESWTK